MSISMSQKRICGVLSIHRKTLFAMNTKYRFSDEKKQSGFEMEMLPFYLLCRVNQKKG